MINHKKRAPTTASIAVCIGLGFGSPQGCSPTPPRETTPNPPAEALQPATVALTLAAQVKGNALLIEGTTDLPNATLIVYEVRHEGMATRTDVVLEKMFAEGNAVVAHGRYSARVNLAGWPAGRVEVWAAFQTIVPGNSKQPAEVISRFGEDGGKLRGSNVTKAGSMKRVELTKTIRLGR